MWEFVCQAPHNGALSTVIIISVIRIRNILCVTLKKKIVKGAPDEDDGKGTSRLQ